MKRTVLALLAVAANSAAAQLTPPIIAYGHPVPARPQNPPTLPLRQPVRPLNPPSARQTHVTYLPAPYGYYYPQAQPQQNVSVNVTNVIETPPAQNTVAFFGSGLFAPGQFINSDTRIWDPDASLAARRATEATVADLDPDRADRAAAADADDVKSLESIVNALYDVLSGPRGTPRNWDRFRGLFSDGAHLIATRSDAGAAARPTVMTADEYASVAGPVLERGVFEREVSRSVEKFGAIAHVFSTYECRRTSSDPKPYQRGINSIQLLNDGTRWWIMSVSWDAERPDNPIPSKYLPAAPVAAPAKR
jgi:hypothetical protein